MVVVEAANNEGTPPWIASLLHSRVQRSDDANRTAGFIGDCRINACACLAPASPSVPCSGHQTYANDAARLINYPSEGPAVAATVNRPQRREADLGGERPVIDSLLWSGPE